MTAPPSVRKTFEYMKHKNLLLFALLAFAQLAAAHGCTLAVIDGVTEAMAAHGLNPDDNTDVAAANASSRR